MKLKVKYTYNPNFLPVPVTGSDVNVSSLTQVTETDYVGNKVYENGVLKRVLIDGGYIEGGTYYFYVNDHLGNNRAVARADGPIFQRNHYYPFGMAFADSYNSNIQPYKYNGKELDRKHGLNLYDYSARYYDQAIGRFTTVDPLAEKYYSISPYAYVMNNPINAIDPDGCSTWVMQNSDGTYRVVGGDLDDNDYNIYVYNINDGNLVRGASIGVTTSTTSFYNTDANNGEGAWVTGAIINPNDRSGENFFGDFIENTPSLEGYMKNATGGMPYDFKRTNGTNRTLYNSEVDIYRGMRLGTKDGKTVYTSARDIGNITAGYAAGASGMPWGASRVAFDALQSFQDRGFSIEGSSTQNAEAFGWRLGSGNVPVLNKLDLLKKPISDGLGSMKRGFQNKIGSGASKSHYYPAMPYRPF